jgi:hypothetical protein
MEAILALGVISGGFLYNRYKKVREGFDDTLVNPTVSSTLGTEFTQYTKDAASRFNPISNLTNPSRNPLYPEGSNITTQNNSLRNLLRNVVAKPKDPSFKLSGANMSAVAINTGSGGKAIEGSKICEKITTVDCNAFDDPNFAANCGICHEGGKNSLGDSSFGGLFILEDDKLNAEDAAKAMRSRRINYRPTVGTCNPHKFSVTKAQCTKIKNQLECEKQQNFGIPGCSQCFEDEKFYSIDEAAGKSDPHFILVGKGKLKITKEGSSNPIEIDLGSSPKKVEIPDFREGQRVFFDLSGADSEMAGYIEGQTASGLFSVDMVRLIEKDSITNAKPRVTNIVQINSGSFNVMRPGRGKSNAVFILTNVFTFLDPTDEDAKLCAAAPLITTEASATFLNSSTCFKKGQAPGKYSLDCLKETFTNAGCTTSGTGYPSTQEKADAISKDATGKNLSIGEIAAKIYKAGLESYSGQRGTQKLSLEEWNTASMFCTGQAITNPCSSPDTNNPVSVECLDYLWKNKGASETGSNRLGPTYTTNTSASSLSGTASQFCTTSGTMAPIKANGQENTASITTARSKGSVQAVKEFYNSIHGTANDNTKTDTERKKAIEECYGINLREIPANDITVGANETLCVPVTKVPSMTGVVNNRGPIEVKDNWIWTFSIIPTATVPNEWANLFLVNTGGATNRGFGTRMPSLYFAPGTTRLYVGITAKDNKVYDNSPNVQLPLNQETNVYISYSDDKLTVKYTGAVETISTITVPECFKGEGTFYATSPWNPPFVGTIKNLSYCTFESKTLSVLDYMPGRGKTNRPNDELPPPPPPPPTPPAPCLPRGATIYSGCGYGYGLKSAHDTQCGTGNLRGTYRIIADGVANGNPCNLPRGATLYLGCGYAYASESERAKQCGDNSGTIGWIGDGL